MKTSASLFTGGGLWDVGAMMAGLTPVWGVEIRADIAAVAEKSIPGLKVVVSDVAAVDYSALPKVDHLHASPSCKKASIANSDGGECEEDIAAALAACRAIKEVGPNTFTLENVWGYREFEAFKLIVSQLTRLGYFVDWWHLNSADYAVPQTRKRLILIARQDRQPRRPQPTHSDTPDPWGLYKPWVGWLEAISDLVDTLPDSEFAPWQLSRLPDELKSMLLAQGSFDGEVVNRSIKAPAFTVTSNSNQAGVKALLLNGAGNTNFEEAKPGKGCRYESDPAQTVTTVTRDGGQLPKAFLLNRNKSERDDHYKPEADPAYTVCVGSNGRQRALLIPGDNASNGVTREADEPMVTVQSRGLGQCPHRAFLTSDNYGSPSDTGKERILQLYAPDAPAMTVRAGQKTTPSSLSFGRVVKMTPRALARFQSVPDSYQLPNQNGLACEIIGNGVPCLLSKAICESLRD